MIVNINQTIPFQSLHKHISKIQHSSEKCPHICFNMKPSRFRNSLKMMMLKMMMPSMPSMPGGDDKDEKKEESAESREEKKEQVKNDPDDVDDGGNDFDDDEKNREIGGRRRKSRW